MARIFANEWAGRGILVNAISPGRVRTDMGGAGAPRSMEQGAASGVFEDGRPIE